MPCFRIGRFWVPYALVVLFQSAGVFKCETIMKMTLICMKMKPHAELIFMWKVSHLDSFWKRGARERGNGRYLLGVKTISNHTHKTGSWYLLAVLFKICDEQLRRTYLFRIIATATFISAIAKFIPIQFLFRRNKHLEKSWFWMYFVLLRFCNDSVWVTKSYKQHYQYDMVVIVWCNKSW